MTDVPAQQGGHPPRARVFISYSRKDIAFARLIQASLQQSQVDTWIDWERSTFEAPLGRTGKVAHATTTFADRFRPQSNTQIPGLQRYSDYLFPIEYLVDPGSSGEQLHRPLLPEDHAADIGNHVAAIETDRGAFTPYGFSIDAPVQVLGELERWRTLLQPYGIWSFERGGSGVDIRDLRPLGVPLLALMTDSQRYFDYQHAASDTWRKVHPRELQLGSATIAAMVFLIDKYGL